MSKDEGLSKFRAFNFEGSEQWSSYIKNVEIMGSREAQLPKLKAKWYKKNIDESFEVEWVASAPASTAPPPSASTTSSAYGSSGGSTPYTRPAGVPPRPPYNAQYSRPPSAGSTAQQTMLLTMHIMVLILALAFLQPIWGALSGRAYRYLLMAIVSTHGYKLHVRYGLPSVLPLTPFPALWDRLRPWLVGVLPSTDFHYLITPLVFMSLPPMALLVVPPVTMAAYHVIAHVSVKYNTAAWYGQLQVGRAHAAMTKYQDLVLVANAGCEVALGVLLILNLFSRSRSLVAAFFFWSQLRTRYHASDAAAQHRKVWSLVDQRTRPLLAAVPMLQVPLGYAQRWFLTPQ